MFVSRLDTSPKNERGNGQVSHLLLAEGQFGSSNLAVTWVEARAGSQQPVHTHRTSEQIYVIVSGRGRMIAGDEEQDVAAGTLVYIPPATPHAIRNVDGETLIYVSASSPPFAVDVRGERWSTASR